MGFEARNDGGTFEYIVDAEADLASIPNPRVSEFALALAEGTIWFHTGTAWQQIGGAGATDHGALTGLLDDDHTQYRLESADHTHQTTGLQGGQLDHGLALTGLTDNDHTQYILHSIADAQGDLLLASAADTFVRLAIGADTTILTSNGTTASWQAAGAATHPSFASHIKFLGG